MQLPQAFDATQHDPTQGAGSLPVGKHPVIISASEVKGTQANDGGLLELTLKIIDGPLVGTTGPYRLNLYNKNQQACEIAHKQLSAISHVVGVFRFNDSSALHDKPFIVEVGLQKGEEAMAKGYTEVKKVFDMAGNEPGRKGPAQQQQPAAQQPQQQPGGNWGQQPQQAMPTSGAPMQQPAQAAWGQQPTQQAQQPVQQQQPPTQQPATQWGQAPQQQPQQQPGGNAGWQQNQNGGGAAPWGQK